MQLSFVVFKTNVLPTESAICAGVFRTQWTMFGFANRLNRLRREEARGAQGAHRNESMMVFEREMWTCVIASTDPIHPLPEPSTTKTQTQNHLGSVAQTPFILVA